MCVFPLCFTFCYSFKKKTIEEFQSILLVSSLSYIFIGATCVPFCVTYGNTLNLPLKILFFASEVLEFSVGFGLLWLRSVPSKGVSLICSVGAFITQLVYVAYIITYYVSIFGESSARIGKIEEFLGAVFSVAFFVALVLPSVVCYRYWEFLMYNYNDGYDDDDDVTRSSAAESVRSVSSSLSVVSENGVFVHGSESLNESFVSPIHPKYRVEGISIDCV